MSTTFAFALVLVASSAVTILATLLIASALQARRVEGPQMLSPGGDAAFLFDSGTLVDANPRGRALLDSLHHADAEEQADWSRISRFLAREFPGFGSTLAELPLSRRARLIAEDGRGTELQMDWLEGALRLTVIDTLAEDAAVVLDRLSFRAMQEEVAQLRQLTEAAPLLSWREDARGRITWANEQYLKHLARSGAGDTLSWPLPALFPEDSTAPRRRALPLGKGREAWFDLTRIEEGDEALVYALPADEAYKAERTKREFIQTLTKTFATLPIGLAVFDRTRRLQMFNPALTDLTGLEPEFLLSKPGIEGFLNRMRDKHVLPEPRDYRSWAKRLLEIETAAPQGEFEETWSLHSGQTFRVSANPHPDGALAFLIEDITSETHLNRNTRAELETTQSVLNQIPDALAVFAPNGELVLTNDAFSRLWTLEGEESLGAVTLPQALAGWRDTGGEAEMWQRIALLARPGKGDGAPVRGVMQDPGGSPLQVEARRTSTGALMIGFTESTGARASDRVRATA
ncbi:PAS domain-containing protein [Pararhodobacter sp. CCB-MM2]|uniref:PAS domain-containing protein n=1 Tax=Pararhodobacter sp. CCB-MM2 TaxID=1786003 RepID=UPI0008351D2E|nr:PAS domain-containing protein [Pararhodobacter sp. CCB-MM2]